MCILTAEKPGPGSGLPHSWVWGIKGKGVWVLPLQLLDSVVDWNCSWDKPEQPQVLPQTYVGCNGFLWGCLAAQSSQSAVSANHNSSLPSPACLGARGCKPFCWPHTAGESGDVLWWTALPAFGPQYKAARQPKNWTPIFVMSRLQRFLFVCFLFLTCNLRDATEVVVLN